MNFVSKFDGSLPFTGTHPKAQTHVESVTTKAPADAIIVNDAQLLFTGDFKRSGSDLVISKGDHELRLEDYFKGDKHPPLASPDGAYLTGNIVDALTGHVQVAQADGSAAAAKIIGHVTKLTGNATVVRNGVSIILNNGDNVHQGDVVQSGSNSTLGITFIDGSVFGLASNAKMVLNEMVYDPNGSNNSSLMSLVSGTISFVAGATAKHGDMKVDTPVATMGIRGTACLVEIEFDLTAVPVNPIGPQLAPPVKFQVLVEPDGTTGSYVLLERATLLPMATVNLAGTVTTVTGTGAVSFLASAQLSPEVMKLISEVFSQKYTDNSNPKSDTHFTDTPVPETPFGFKFASGDLGQGILRILSVTEQPGGPSNAPTGPNAHIPGPPQVFASSNKFSELDHPTGSSLIDTTSGAINYVDINVGDTPSARTGFASFTYKDAQGNDVKASLTPTQLAAIAAVEVPLVVTQDPNGKNFGSATWAYNIPDGALDFLADGEKLVLTYRAFVDNNYAPNNETGFYDFTITITGTNDVPTIESSPQIAAVHEIADPDTHRSNTPDTAAGTVSFKDVDLTDTHTTSISDVVGTSGVTTGLADHDTLLGWLHLDAFHDSTDGVTGTQAWSFSAADHYFDYLAEGETVTLTYSVEVDDHHGGTVAQDVVVTVTGSNDAPELAADVSGEAAPGLHSIQERPGLTGDTTDLDLAGGSLAFVDLDLSDSHKVSSSAPGFVWLDKDGESLSLTDAQQSALAAASKLDLTLHDSTGTGSGSVDFDYSALDSTFDFLACGETLTITYDVTVTDKLGVTSTQPVTITVTGTNDAPVAYVDTNIAPVIEAGNDAENNFLPGVDQATGDVLANDTDVDLTDTHNVVGVVAGTVTGVLLTGVGDTITGTYGSLVLNADGTWTYTLNNDNPLTNALAQGQHVNDIFSYTESDHHGGTSTTTLTIDITGTNDTPETNAAPVAATDVNEGPPVVEKGVNPGNDPFDGVNSATGNVLANDFDIDTGDTKTVQGVASGTPAGVLSTGVGVKITGIYGCVTIAADGTWTYKLNNTSAATQGLTQGEHVSDVFTYTMHDTVGSTASATLTIDITGTNDAPTLADVNAGALADTAANDSFPDLTGAMVGVDVDSGETATLTYGTFDGLIAVNTAVTGLYGSLTVNLDGTYTYVADAAAINALHAGTYADTFTVQTTDVNGATGTATFTVDVTGANDTPTLADVHTGTPTDTAANDSFANLTGALVGTDLDSGETATLGYAALDSGSATNAAVAGLYGKLTVDSHGAYVYVPDAALINALHTGSYADTFTVQTTDVNGATGTATFTVDVTGANDTPTLADVHTGTPTDTAANDSFANLTGVLVGTDLDSGETATLGYAALDNGSATNAAVAGLYGKLTVDSHGSYIYVPDAALINALHTGTYTDTFTVQTTDVNGAIGTATFTVDVTGANDTPIVAAALTVSANEGDASFTQDLLAGASDVDDGETASLTVADLTYMVDGVAVPSLPAGLSLGSDHHTLTINPGAAAFDYLAQGAETVIDIVYDVTDVHGAAVPQTEEITIHGTNDAPSIVAESNPPAHGVMIVNPASIIVEPAGQNTNSLGIATETFDSKTAGSVSDNGTGTGNFTSSALGATFTYSGHAGIVHGSSSVSAAPFMGPLPGGADTTNYLSIGGGATETITFTTSKNAFGLYWGSIDSYNTVKFYDGNTLVGSYTGADVSPLLANGNQGSFAANGYVEFVLLHSFNKVVLGSSSNAFEIDNISAGNVPAPHSALVGTVSGTMSVHDVDIGDPLTGVVSQNATFLFNNSPTLPNGVSLTDLIKAGNITFDSVQSDGGTDVLHWSYDPHGANLDFLHAGDVLKLTYTAQVSDGHGSNGSQALTVTLVGTNNATNVSTLKFVDGTTGNDTFNNVGGGTTVFGNGGHDNFAFKPGAGSATIADFQPGDDVITFASSMFSHNPANVLAAAHDDGHGNTVIALGGPDTITLQHVQVAHLSASDFHFV